MHKAQKLNEKDMKNEVNVIRICLISVNYVKLCKIVHFYSLKH